jgi:hypothetical protein
MSFRMTLAASAAAMATLAAAGAQAATLYSYAGPTAELPTDSAVTATFNAGAGPGLLTFTIDGFASLDGQNSYEDDFSLAVNNVQQILATFNLGGGGPDVVYSAPGGATFNDISGNGTNITWNGGEVLVSTPISLQHGSNTLTFGYTSLEGQGYAGFQGTGDEGWGLRDIQVSGNAVPEPATWGLMIVGFGGMGGLLRRQRRQQAAAATA